MALDSSTTFVIPKAAYNVLRRITGETRPDVALNLALRDLVRLRIEAARHVSAAYEQKYRMSFSEFEQAWQADQVAEKYSYPVEQDFQDWEAAITDLQTLEQLQAWMV